MKNRCFQECVRASAPVWSEVQALQRQQRWLGPARPQMASTSPRLDITANERSQKTGPLYFPIFLIFLGLASVLARYSGGWPIRTGIEGCRLSGLIHESITRTDSKRKKNDALSHRSLGENLAKSPNTISNSVGNVAPLSHQPGSEKDLGSSPLWKMTILHASKWSS
jgi:hypothetical protein